MTSINNKFKWQCSHVLLWSLWPHWQCDVMLLLTVVIETVSTREVYIRVCFMYGKHYMMNHAVTNLTVNKIITYAGKPLHTYHTLEFHCSLGLSRDSLWYIMMSSLFNVNIDPNLLIQMLHFLPWSYITTQIGPLHHTHTTSWHCTPPSSPTSPVPYTQDCHDRCTKHALSMLAPYWVSAKRPHRGVQ